MSVAGISSIMQVSPYLQGPQSNPSLGGTRLAEDNAARELIVDLQKGDLADAQKAYNNLAAFGANNSGPWAAGSQMQSEFKQLGQDLASGNLSGARSDATTLATNQLQHDMKALNQNYSSSDSAAFQQAVKNYQGDYWAIFGTNPQSLQPTIGGAAPDQSTGINVTA